jgi:hypothetical protein
MDGAFLITFLSRDGEEREERWHSVEAFRNWAVSQGGGYAFTAYRLDEDEWVVVEQGRVGDARRGRPAAENESDAQDADGT